MSHKSCPILNNNNSLEVDEETGEVFFRKPSTKINERRSKSRSRSRSTSKSPEPQDTHEKCDPYTPAVRSAIAKRNPNKTSLTKIRVAARPTLREPGSRSSSRRTRSRDNSSTAPTIIKDLPNKVLRQVFGYLELEDLQVCSRVCHQWKCLTDLRLRGPFIFQGRSTYGHYYASDRCRNFVEYLLDLEPRFYRPVEIRFHSMSNGQARMVVEKLDAHFRVAVRHMESLTFVKCSFNWKNLMAMLKCFTKQLRMLSDVNSAHFSQSSICSSCLWRKEHGQEQLKKEIDRQEFKDFKDSLRGLRRLSITRKTVTNELPIYLCILAQGVRHLDELEINLGPYETPNPSNDTEFCNLLALFVKELQGLLFKNKESLKIIRFSWSDKNFTGYFSTCLEVLDKVYLNQLHTVSLHFDNHAMRGKGFSPTSLQDFLEYHYARRLRSFKLDRMTLNENWTSTSEFLDELLETIPPSLAGLDFKVLISDSKGTLKMTPVHQILRLEVFRKFISDIHFSIENESTKSISQMFGKEWHKKNNYPMVKSILITFEPLNGMMQTTSMNKKTSTYYKQFNSFNIDLISSLFPNLTQLKISDKLGDHNQIFTPIIGRKLVSGVSYAQLENKDIQLIAKYLKKLKVLRLWVNMSTVDDHGVTGIHRGDISILLEEDEHFTWNNFHHDVLPSFSKLPLLEELSLRGLGPAVTDLSLKFGFKNLYNLKLLELYGKMSVTQKGKQDFRRSIKNNEDIETKVRIKRRVT